MKSLYLDCFSGASGNMILGALLDVGLDGVELESALSGLEIGDFKLEISRVNRSGITGTFVDPVFPESKRYRHLPEIESLIRDSGLQSEVIERSVGVFRRLAKAEAKVHGIALEKVHFHEVGAVDTIIDIVGACFGLYRLGIDEVFVSKINTGHGFVEIEHGKYPVPPPAVQELLVDFPTYSGDVDKELTTPTGAAIIAEFASYQPSREITAKKVGYGAGSFNPKGHPNVIRAVVCETEKQNEPLIILETNLDDTTGESLGSFMEMALEAGALDCWFTPIFMKKNRPAQKVSVLAEAGNRENLIALLYKETMSLGVRVIDVERDCLERRVEEVETDFGTVRVKVAELNGRIVNYKPEFDELVELAKTTGTSVKHIKSAVEAVCFEIFGEAGKVERKQAGS